MLGNAFCDSGKLYGRKLEVGSDTVECLLRIRIKVWANKVNVVAGVNYRPLSQDDSSELFFKQLSDTSRSATLVLMGYFSLQDINWEYHAANTDPEDS